MRVQLIGPRRARDDRGAVALLVAVLTLAFAVVLAFVTDFGMAYANKRNLQNGVDAAALAVGNDIALNAPMSADCATMKALVNADRATAESVFRQNVPAMSASLEAGSAGFAAHCVGPTSSILVISTSATQESPMFFGGVTGMDELEVRQNSRVIVGPVGKITGLRPFALCKVIADQAAPPFPSAAWTLDLDNADAGCGTAPGNFGALDLSNGNGNPGSDIYDWVEHGYPEAISTTTPFTFEPRTGAAAANFETELMAVLGDEIVVPVYVSRAGPGNNAEYNIVDFAAIQICAIKTSTTPHQVPCADPSSFPTASNARYLQFRFVRYVPIGDISLTCPLGHTCDNGLRVAKLAD